MRRPLSSRGFTLLELLITSFMVSILMAIAIPTFLGWYLDWQARLDAYQVRWTYEVVYGQIGANGDGIVLGIDPTNQGGWIEAVDGGYPAIPPRYVRSQVRQVRVSFGGGCYSPQECARSDFIPIFKGDSDGQDFNGSIQFGVRGNFPRYCAVASGPSHRKRMSVRKGVNCPGTD